MTWAIVCCLAGLAAGEPDRDQPDPQAVPAPAKSRSVSATVAEVAETAAEVAGDLWGAWVAVDVRDVPGQVGARRDPQALAALEKECERSVGTMYRAEVAHLRSVCDLTDREFAAFEKKCEPARKAAVKQYAVWLYDTNQGALAEGMNWIDPDPRTHLVCALVGLARARMSPERADKYESDLKLRAAARRRTVLAAILAMLDQRLLLTPDQRRRIGDILSRNWNPRWTLELLAVCSDQMPPLPEKQLLPVLTGAQAAVWREYPKLETTQRWPLLEFELFEFLQQNEPENAPAENAPAENAAAQDGPAQDGPDPAEAAGPKPAKPEVKK